MSYFIFLSLEDDSYEHQGENQNSNQDSESSLNKEGCNDTPQKSQSLGTSENSKLNQHGSPIHDKTTRNQDSRKPEKISDERS